MLKRIKKWIKSWKPCDCPNCKMYQAVIDGRRDRTMALSMGAMHAWENARTAIDPELKKSEEERGWQLAFRGEELAKMPLPDPDDFPPCENGRDRERLYYHRADLDHRLNETGENK